jgi:hypothetical protein
MLVLLPLLLLHLLLPQLLRHQEASGPLLSALHSKPSPLLLLLLLQMPLNLSHS